MNIKQFFGTVPEITEYEIASDKIPQGFDGFCIAHISDTHSRPANGLFELIEGKNPDIICITGDMLQDDENAAPDFWMLFDRLLSLAPVYLVTGNHDVWREDSYECFRKIQNMGGILLNPGTRILEKNGDKITISGIGDPFSRIPRIVDKNISASISKLESFDGYKILLFHRANLFDKVKDAGFDLVLSGHMHGGQIRLPVFGGMFAPTSSILTGKMLFPKYSEGKYQDNETVMIVNRGASNTLPVPRFANPPEVGIIRLVSQ